MNPKPISMMVTLSEVAPMKPMTSSEAQKAMQDLKDLIDSHARSICGLDTPSMTDSNAPAGVAPYPYKRGENPFFTHIDDFPYLPDVTRREGPMKTDTFVQLYAIPLKLQKPGFPSVATDENTTVTIEEPSPIRALLESQLEQQRKDMKDD